MIDMNDDTLFCADLPTIPRPEMGTVLVTGASGYIGGRLVPEIIARGYSVRIMTRSCSKELKARWPGVEVISADALDKESLKKAMKDVYAAYYLIHSLHLSSNKFELVDNLAAKNFKEAAEESRVSRIIYLGGLGDMNGCLSPHLRSRLQVAQELTSGSVPVTVLRAAVIIGSGSASYEILKHMVKYFPIVLAPKWARTKCQPIAIRDVIKYLVGVMESDVAIGKYYDIGGEEILDYQTMMTIMAEIMEKKRIFIPLPFSAPRLFSYVLSVCSPVPAHVTMNLMGSCQTEVICQDNEILKVIPFKQLSYREAVYRALKKQALI